MKKDEIRWTFFSNHAHVYFILAAHNDITIRDIALKVGITERTVLGLINELEESGYITREKEGRSNRYKIAKKTTLRHPLESNVLLIDLFKLIKKSKSKS